MSLRPKRTPSYRLHTPSGLAVVTIDGKDIYLGRHGTPESEEQYHRLIVEWLANRQRPAPASNGTPSPDVTINELILGFLHFAERHYRQPDGTPTGEMDNIRDALRPLRQLYGRTFTRLFDASSLEAIQGHMVRSGRLARTTINARINRIRRIVRWGVRKKLVPVEVLQSIETVPGLERGRTQAREPDPIRPVPIELVEATIPLLPRPVATMVEVMRHSNARAEDVVAMRACDIQQTGDLWVYVPQGHKNHWRGHARTIYLGRRAQAAIEPFLQTSADPRAYLFSPQATVEQLRAERAKKRATKRTPSEMKRRRKDKPKRQAGQRYTVNTFQQAIRRACRKAGVPAWNLLALRHATLTAVRARYGVEGAQASAGHRRVETTQIYAERIERLAQQVALEMG